MVFQFYISIQYENYLWRSQKTEINVGQAYISNQNHCTFSKSYFNSSPSEMACGG